MKFFQLAASKQVKTLSFSLLFLNIIVLPQFTTVTIYYIYRASQSPITIPSFTVYYGN